MRDELVTLKSSEGEPFKVEWKVARMSTVVNDMVADSGTGEEIMVPNVKTEFCVAQ